MNLLAQTRPFRRPDEVIDVPVGPTTQPIATLRGLEAIFENVVVVATAFAAIVLFVMLLVGGFKYITSGGNKEAADGAKKTLTFAIGGFFLLVLSYIILAFIEQFTGIQITIFRVFLP